MYDDNLKDMIEKQIIARGINNPKVIEAFYEVDRRLFVPESLQSMAYADSPLPIGYNQTISQPYIVAYMTDAAKLTGHSKVLEVGTGSGYQAAILSKICHEVYTIEIVEPLAKEIKIKLKNLGYENIHTRFGDGYEGWPEAAPFDAIIITAAPEFLPKTLLSQLKEGGRMIIPIGKYNQELYRIIYYHDKIKKEKLLDVNFVPMVHVVE